MAFTNIFSTTTRGALTFTGNTSGLSKLSNANLAGTVGSIGAFTSITIPTPTVGDFPTDNTLVPAGTTLNISDNGSCAILNIPAGSTILKAQLVWGGNYYGQDGNTGSIAKLYNAKIYHHKFDNNFSKARNIALENATKNWILHLDCDEEFDYVDSFKLKELLKNSTFEGHCLNLTNIINGEKHLSLPTLRIFRNKKEYRYEGRIHEQIQNSIKKHSGENTIQVTDLKLYHYGYDNNNVDIESKIKRNLNILETTPENERDGFYYYNLGNEYNRTNDLEKTLGCYLKAMNKKDNIGYKIYLPIYIINTLYSLERYKRGVEYGKKFLKDYPTYKDLYFVIALCFNKLNDTKMCKDYLNKYIEFSKVDYGYPNFNFSSSRDINQLLIDIKNY